MIANEPLGSSGISYIALLIAPLRQHPTFRLRSRATRGQPLPIWSSLANAARADVRSSAERLTGSTWCHRPPQASLALVRNSPTVRVVISLAFRLKDASLYPTWYGFAHDQPELLASAVFGCQVASR